MKYFGLAVIAASSLFILQSTQASNWQTGKPIGSVNYAPASSHVQLAANSKKKYKKKSYRKSAHRHHSSVFPSKRKATGRTTFIFSPRYKAWAAYDPNGNLVRTGRASGGKGYCRDVGRSCRTPRGHFRVYRKGPPHCRSSKYPLGRGGAKMPYCMFFYKGFAIHGSPDVPNYNASHGCIRVRPAAARWLSNNFMRVGTKVVVTSY